MDITAFLNKITTPHLLVRVEPKNQDIPGKRAPKEGVVRTYVFYGHEPVGQECTVTKKGMLLQHHFYFVQNGILHKVSQQQFQQLEVLVALGRLLDKLFDNFAAHHTFPQSISSGGVTPEVLALLKEHEPTQELLAQHHITWEESDPDPIFTKHK